MASKNQDNKKTTATSTSPRSSKPTRGKKGAKGQSKNEPVVSKARVFRVSVGMVLMVVALFLVASFTSYVRSGAEDFSFCEGHQSGEIMDGNVVVHNIGGKLGLLVSYFFINECFGVASYLIPVYLIILSLWLIGSFRFSVIKDFVKLGLLMLWLSVVLSVVGQWLPGMEDSHVSLGGNHGSAIHALLYNVVGDIGVYGIIILSVLFVLIYFSVRTVDRITEFFRFRQLKKMKEKLSEKLRRNGVDDEEDEEEDGEGTETDSPDDEDRVTELSDETPTTVLFDSEGNIVTEDAAEIQPTDQVPDEQEELLPADDQSTDSSQEVQLIDMGKGSPVVRVDEADFEIAAAKETEKGKGNIERGDIETPYDPKLELSKYKYPSIDLLDKNDDAGPQIDIIEQNANKDRIQRVLKSFGVEIGSIKATIGPTITLYEITLAEGQRINRIRNLGDDIALSLAAEGIRIIAPIPGKGTIGIEVPNKKKRVVSMESVINSRTYKESKMELPCALGKTITNEVFMVDLAKAPHMLVAGATGMGKSVGLNAIVTSLLFKKHPAELKIVMVDPKKVEFSVYAPIANQFLAKLEDEEDAIITDNQRVVKTLNSLCKLMDDRYLLLKQARVRNIKEYNELFKARKLNPLEGHEYMPYYVVIIDEFGDLIMTAGKDIELPICRIAQLARAVGIHMIIATQRPTTSIITGTIKANFPARIAFRVAAMMDSRIILDRPGANQLIGRGDMLFLQGADPIRVQCAFVDTPEVKRICEFISEQQQFPCMTYLPEPPMEEGDGVGGKDVDMNHLDPLFAEAAKLIVSQQSGSTSLIQRKFSIGYNRAGRLMDQLETAGVVGAQIGAKPREVMIQDVLTLDSLLNTLNL